MAKSLCVFLILFTFMVPTAHAGCDLELKAMEPDFNADMEEWVTQAFVPGYLEKKMNESVALFRRSIHKIKSIPSAERSFENTVLAADQAFDDFFAPGLTLRIINQLSKISSNRKTEVEAFEKEFAIIMTEFYSDAELYQAIKATPVRMGPPHHLKEALLRRLMAGGAALSQEERQKLKALDLASSVLGTQLKASLSKNRSSVLLSDGRRIPVSSPQLVRSFLTQESNEEFRRQVYLKSRDQVPANAERLFQLTRLNFEMAQLLGKANLVEQIIDERSLSGGVDYMVRLLKQLGDRFSPAARNRLKELAQLKIQQGSALPLAPWDFYYFENQLQALEQGEEDIQQEAAAFFTATEFLDNFFAEMSYLFEIEFELVKGAPVWHPSVSLYKVRYANSKTTIGYLYVDMYSRPGKDSSGAFVDEFISRRQGAEARLPVSVMSTNWGAWIKRKSLNVPLIEVETTAHEFGHALHTLIHEGGYRHTSGFAFPTDYVEVPSTTLDHLMKEPEFLIALSSKRGTHEKMSPELAQKIVKLRQGFKLLDGDFFSSTHLHNTVFLSLLDVSLQQSIGQMPDPSDMHQLYQQLFQEFYELGPFLDDHFIQTFSHIAGDYAGNYSSYIQAGLVASNIIERIKELGHGSVRDPKAWRIWMDKLVKQPVGEKTASQILRDFMGRPIRVDPLLRELGM